MITSAHKNVGNIKLVSQQILCQWLEKRKTTFKKFILFYYFQFDTTKFNFIITLSNFFAAVCLGKQEKTHPKTLFRVAFHANSGPSSIVADLKGKTRENKLFYAWKLNVIGPFTVLDVLEKCRRPISSGSSPGTLAPSLWRSVMSSNLSAG